VARTDLQHLSEGQRLSGVDLTRAEAADLNRSGLVTVEPDVEGWRVTAEHAVGAVRRGELVVRVTPKVGTAKVLALLARAQGVRGLNVDREIVGVTADADLSAVLAVLFAQEAAVAMASGPLRGYRSEDQTLPVLRGRVRLREQGLRRFGLPIPLEVTVDEWTLDTDDNRRLRAATAALLALPDVPTATARQLRRLDRMLSEVARPVPGAPLPAWTPTRLNVRMHRLLHLADVVLAHASVEHAVGSTQTHGFVVNMAWLFETLLARLLKELTPGWEAQERLPLDTENRLVIKPDLVLYGPRGIEAVADTKYKLLDEDAKIPNPDVYQLVTYSTRLGLRTGHLIYADDADAAGTFDILGTGRRLIVHRVDLTRPLADIERQVAHLDSAIREETGRGSARTHAASGLSLTGQANDAESSPMRPVVIRGGR
jgi:5-methylcytosine-specific restriction enzyme subunit McrC